MKIIAFYLPQYHEISENNKWWGKGFTEWSNTKKAKQLFRSHYQPREPYQDNYYDLSDPSVMSNQMKLAKKYGIGAFCFYHYWFGGKKLLEKPIEMLLKNSKADLPFCLAWANEPWTRVWDGDTGSKEILVPQIYGKEEEWREHFLYLLDFFKDHRYLCVDGKPVFIIYRARSIPGCNDMLDTWNKMAIENGFSGLYFIQMITSFGFHKYSNRFNACIDFEPMRTLGVKEKENNRRKWNKQLNFYNKYKKAPIISKYILNKVDYDSVYQSIIQRPVIKDRKTFYSVFPDWDNSPRKGSRGLIMVGATPKKFEKYLSILIRKSIRENNEFLFINAWNEWGEGAYLEADKRYGFSYINAVRRALKKNNLA